MSYDYNYMSCQVEIGSWGGEVRGGGGGGGVGGSHMKCLAKGCKSQILFSARAARTTC